MEKKGMIKWILISIGIILLILIAGIAVLCFNARKAAEGNSWLTVFVAGEINSETSDAFAEEVEVLEGDTVHLGNVILQVKKIKRDGTAFLSVIEGEAMINNTPVKEITLTGDEPVHIKIKNGSFTLSVVSHKYR